MFAAQIPIAEHAARPTERTSRDFVPWRFSNAGLRSAWIARRGRRPKTLYERPLVKTFRHDAYQFSNTKGMRRTIGQTFR
jgi:hypothetical protein